MNKTGNWIYIIKEIPVEPPIDKLSIWFAKPTEFYLKDSRTRAGERKIRNEIMEYLPKTEISVRGYQRSIWSILNGHKLPSDRLTNDIEKLIDVLGYTKESFEASAEIITPFGPVKIHSNEYNIVDLEWALKLVESDSHMIRYLSNDGSIQQKMKNISVQEKVFYLQSRGISFTEAMKMVSGEIKTQHLMYFDPFPQYIEMFSRTYLRDCKNKIEYCEQHGYEQLLQYKSNDDGVFTLHQYLEHLTKQYNHA